MLLSLQVYVYVLLRVIVINNVNTRKRACYCGYQQPGGVGNTRVRCVIVINRIVTRVVIINRL